MCIFEIENIEKQLWSVFLYLIRFLEFKDSLKICIEATFVGFFSEDSSKSSRIALMWLGIVNLRNNFMIETNRDSI